MDRRERRLKIRYSSDAANELDQIWIRNAKKWSYDQADTYHDFLIDGIEELRSAHKRYPRVSPSSELQHLSLVFRPGADGHRVIFQVLADEDLILVVHIFHTKMDYLTRLHAERDSED